MILGFFVYRNLTLRDMWAIFMKMARTTGVVFLVIAAASILGWVLTIEQIPEKVAALMLSVSTNKWVVMGMILLLLLSSACSWTSRLPSSSSGLSCTPWR